MARTGSLFSCSNIALSGGDGMKVQISPGGAVYRDLKKLTISCLTSSPSSHCLLISLITQIWFLCLQMMVAWSKNVIFLSLSLIHWILDSCPYKTSCFFKRVMCGISQITIHESTLLILMLLKLSDKSLYILQSLENVAYLNPISPKQPFPCQL